MDPLSIAASIIAVLQAANAVVTVCAYYKGASKVVDELRSLRDVLEALAPLAAQAECADAEPAVKSRLPTLKVLCQPEPEIPEGMLARCLEELKALEKRLAPPDWSNRLGRRGQALVQALCWPLKDGDTRKLLDKLGRFKTTLNLAISADEVTLALEIRETTRLTQETALDIQKDIAFLKVDDHRERINRWLSAPDPSLNQNAACKKRLPATGNWFVASEQFAKWKRKPNSLLWLHGIPGCGKTILSSTIIQDVLQQNFLISATAVMYFYFDFNDATKQSSEKMTCSLIKQLLAQCTDVPQSLALLYSSKNNGEHQPAANELLITLREMVNEFDEIFIILDALDECNDRMELLTNIEEMVGWNEEKLHMLATSRRERDIEERLEHILGEEERICIQSVLVNADIRAYVHDRLQTDRSLKRWHKMPEVQKEIETELADKANGMFRWAVCQLDTLGKCLNRPMLRKALVSLPKTLDDTYARILDNIDDEHQANALKLLQWLTYSARPLRIQELAEIVTVDKMDVEDELEFDSDRRFPEPRDVLALCSSLVSTVTTTLQEDMGGSEDPSESEEAGWGSEEADWGSQEAVENPVELVRLAHFSVKEYLVSERIQAGSARRYYIRKIDAHLSIAEICLAYLFQFDQPGSLTLQTLKESPLANYAAEYWLEHARWAGKEHKGMHQLIMKLFVSKKDAYFNSIKIHDPESGRSWPDLTLKLTDIPPPLYYALCFGLAESTRLLVEAGVDINAEGQHGTALQMAAIEGDDHLAKKLLAAGADVNAKGRYGTALQIAAGNGHDHFVQRLLDAGTDVNAEGSVDGTALQRATGNDRNHIVQRLLDAGANVNTKRWYGTALQRAAGNGHDYIVQRLLDAGADINAKGRYDTALQRAVGNGHNRIVQRLLDAGANVNAGREYGTALQIAAGNGHDHFVQSLLDAGADINAEGGFYGTALQRAAGNGHDHIMQRLLDAGADVNAKGRYGTALQRAAGNGHDYIVQRLLDAGADVNAGGEYGTALQRAAGNGHDHIVQRLLDAGADINAEGGFDGTALKRVAENGHDHLVQRLLDAGADINAEGGFDGTALKRAAENGHDHLVQRLLDAGADVNQGGPQTALRYVKSRGHDDIVQRLLKAGAED